MNALIRNPNMLSQVAKLVLLMLLAVIVFTPLEAWAQQMPTLEGIYEASGDKKTDTSRLILERMFMEFGETPFTAVGSAKTLLGMLFFTFNAVIFVVGTSYIIYQVVMAIASSAHEGEVLGKRMNSLWAPIRLSVGVFGMFPVFMGFSLAQSVLLSVALLGIGMANMMVKTAVTAGDSFHNLIPPPGLVDVSRTNGSISDDAAHNLFLMHVCMLANREYQASFEKLPIVNTFFQIGIEESDKGVISYGGDIDCGSVLIHDQTDNMRNNDGMLRMLGLGGFRNPAVAYDDIIKMAKGAVKARQETLFALNKDVEALAQKWFQDAKQGITPVYPLQELQDSVARHYGKEAEKREEIVKNGSGGGDLKGFSRGIAEKMQEGGWLSIGSWYSAFAEHDAAIQSAFVQNFIEVVPPNFNNKELPNTIQDPLLRLMSAKEEAEKISPSDPCKLLGVVTIPLTRNEVGQCSFGQSFAHMLLSGISEGGNGMVNPILTAKNLGDYMLSFVGGVMMIGAVDKITDFFPAKNLGKAVAMKTVLENIKDKAPAEGLGAKILSAIFMGCFILGLVFAVYIPLIPFITWFTATVSYFASVIEGLVGAQIWAFTHLSSEGEGMGQRTEKGYVYLLNMLLRPGLMVLGFFFASALMTLMGTFLFQQLGTAIANMQGDTNTGPLIILGILIVFMIILITLIQTVCNLIYEIPDRVIAWFGHSMEARLAQQMDSKSESKFERATQWSGSIAAIKGIK